MFFFLRRQMIECLQHRPEILKHASLQCNFSLARSHPIKGEMKRSNSLVSHLFSLAEVKACPSWPHLWVIDTFWWARVDRLLLTANHNEVSAARLLWILALTQSEHNDRVCLSDVVPGQPLLYSHHPLGLFLSDIPTMRLPMSNGFKRRGWHSHQNDQESVGNWFLSEHLELSPFLPPVYLNHLGRLL